MARHHEFGKWGEDIAAAYILRKGYRILHRHWTCQWGELDCVAERDGKIIFFEVKTRRHLVLESLTYTKKKHLLRSLQIYLKRYGRRFTDCQVDFIGIETSGLHPKITHLENVLEARI